MKAIGLASSAILSCLLAIAAPAYPQQERQGEKRDRPEQQSKHEQASPEPHHAQQQRQPEQRQRQPQAAQPERREQNQRQHAQQAPRPQQPAADRNQQERAQQQPRPAQHAPSQHAQQQAEPIQQRRTQEPQQHAEQRHAQPQRQVERAEQPHGQQWSPRTQAERGVQDNAWQQHRAQRWQSDHRTWEQRGGYRGYRIPDNRYRGYFGPEHGFRINTLPFRVVAGYPRFQYQGYWISAVDPWPEYWTNDWYETDDVYVSYVDNGYYLYDRRYPSSGIAIAISF